MSQPSQPSQPSDLLDLAAIAQRIGVSYASIRRYRSQDATFPQPDAMLGQSPGWHANTIDAWQAQRPGRGAGGGRKPRS